jgi:hypothetical protein
MTDICIRNRNFDRLSPEQCQELHNASLEILAEHQPEPLPDDVAQAVEAVVRRAKDGTGV